MISSTVLTTDRERGSPGSDEGRRDRDDVQADRGPAQPRDVLERALGDVVHEQRRCVREVEDEQAEHEGGEQQVQAVDDCGQPGVGAGQVRDHEGGRAAASTRSSSTRFSVYTTLSPRLMYLVTPEWVIQMPPMKAKLM